MSNFDQITLPLPNARAKPFETALASYGGMEPPTGRILTPGASNGGWPRCPNTNFRVVDRTTGEILSARCGRVTCHACVGLEALDRARALALAEPTQQIRLTLVGAFWQEVRGRMRAFHRRIRRYFPNFQQAFVIEENPMGTGLHLHGWVHGAELDLLFLEQAAVASGMGNQVWAGEVQVYRPSNGAPMIKYGFKNVLNPEPGVAALWPKAERHLEVNGGRLLHSTDSYYRRGADGGLIPTLDKAISVAREVSGMTGRYMRSAI